MSKIKVNAIIKSKEWKNKDNTVKGLKLTFLAHVPCRLGKMEMLRDYQEHIKPNNSLELKFGDTVLIYSRIINIPLKKLLTCDLDRLKLNNQEGFIASVKGHYNNYIKTFSDIRYKLSTENDNFEFNI